MSKEWPLEGYFECGGQGLLVTPDCLGREFASRTANYDLIIGLPQPGTRQRPASLRPPQWTHGPIDEDEDEDDGDDEDDDDDEDDWGLMLPDVATLLVGVIMDAANRPMDNLWDEANAHILRCRFYTSLTASTDEEVDAAAGDFVNELEEWWTRFTSWVSILTSQDFVQLGGHGGGILFTKNWDVKTWTTDADGQRAREKWLGYARPDWTNKTPWSCRTSKRAQPRPAIKVRPLRNGCSFAMRVRC
jgi:hypothetical protein